MSPVFIRTLVNLDNIVARAKVWSLLYQYTGERDEWVWAAAVSPAKDVLGP